MSWLKRFLVGNGATARMLAHWRRYQRPQRGPGRRYLLWQAQAPKGAHAGDAQEPREVWHLASAGQYFVVKLGDQRIGGAPFCLRDFGQDVPDHVLQPDAGERPVQAHAACPLLILDRIGLDKESTHVPSFLKYPARARPALASDIGLRSRGCPFAARCNRPVEWPVSRWSGSDSPRRRW